MVNQPTIHDRYARRLAEPNWYTQWCTPAVVGYADASSEIHNDTMTDNRPTIKKLQVVQAGPPLVKAIPYRAITPVNTFDAVAAIPVRLTQGSFLDMTYFFFPTLLILVCKAVVKTSFPLNVKRKLLDKRFACSHLPVCIQGRSSCNHLVSEAWVLAA